MIDESSIQLYMKEIGCIPVLSPEEEVEYVRAAQSGDVAARNKLVESNLKLVASLAKRYKGCGVLYEDLLQEGSIGLIRAVDSFKINQGYRFSTYALWWARQYITRAIANQERTIRIPVHMTEVINKIKDANKMLTPSLGHKPSSAELSEYLHLPIDKIEETFQYMTEIVSLDIPVGEKDESTLGDLIEDNKFLDPAKQYETVAMVESLNEVLSTLSIRECDIIKKRFGFTTDGKQMTLEDIGIEYNLSKERIRQIELKALRKLRHPFRAKMIKECLMG